LQPPPEASDNPDSPGNPGGSGSPAEDDSDDESGSNDEDSTEMTPEEKRQFKALFRQFIHSQSSVLGERRAQRKMFRKML
jgi:hypothetical protein